MPVGEPGGMALVGLPPSPACTDQPIWAPAQAGPRSLLQLGPWLTFSGPFSGRSGQALLGAPPLPSMLLAAAWSEGVVLAEIQPNPRVLSWKVAVPKLGRLSECVGRVCSH